MNYLAHFYLAHNDEGLIVGNLLADFVRGKEYMKLPEDFQRGVILHRKIDEYTDRHPEVEKTKSRLRENHGKYASVISDVFYDYFLGINWKEYSQIPLRIFTGNIYSVLKSHQNRFPTQAQITLGYMSKHDWLYHYSSYYGIEMALQGLSRRAKFNNNMHGAIEDLKENEKYIENEFKPFFKELENFVSEEKLNL